MRGRSTTQESSPQRRDGEALRRELPSRSFFWGSDWRLIPRRQNRSGALDIVHPVVVSSAGVLPSRARVPASSIAITPDGRLIGGWATTSPCPRSGPGAASSLVTPDGAALPLPRNEADRNGAVAGAVLDASRRPAHFALAGGAPSRSGRWDSRSTETLHRIGAGTLIYRNRPAHIPVSLQTASSKRQASGRAYECPNH